MAADNLINNPKRKVCTNCANCDNCDERVDNGKL